MTVTTKVNPGDKIYIMIDNKPVELTVDTIQININLTLDKQLIYGIHYNCKGGQHYRSLKENEFFLTKEDLKNSIFK